MPRPKSLTSRIAVACWRLKQMLTREAPECRCTLVKASCSTRNKAVSIAIGNRVRSVARCHGYIDATPFGEALDIPLGGRAETHFVQERGM